MVGINDLNQVYGWGENNTGQLGNGTFMQYPFADPGLGIAICAASNNSVMAVDESGEFIYIWEKYRLGIGGNSVVNFSMYHPTLTVLIRCCWK